MISIGAETHQGLGVHVLLWDTDWLIDATDEAGIELTDEQDDKWNAAMNALRAVWCDVFGHSPTRDHCGLPEHDFCLMCGKGMPRRVA